MPKRDMYNDHKEATSLLPALRSTDANGSGVDLAGYRGALVLAHVGAPGDTLSGSVKIEFEVEESDNNSDWTDVANADLVGYVSGTNTGTFAVVDANGEASAIYAAAYIGTKRYIRIVENRTGTHTTGTVTSASVVRGHPEIESVRA